MAFTKMTYIVKAVKDFVEFIIKLDQIVLNIYGNVFLKEINN